MNAAIHAQLPNIHLYEAAPEFVEVGAGVNITRTANRVLDIIGVGQAMMRRSSHTQYSYMEYRHYRTGEYLGHMDEFGEPHSRVIHRAHLLDALTKSIHDERISLNKRLTAIQWSGEGCCYTLTFADGTTAEADIVVGCDGIKSVVRQHLGLSDHPIYSGQMVYRGFVNYEDVSPETATLLRKTINFRGPKRHIITLPIGNDDTMTARVGIIAFMTEPLENWTSESWMKAAPLDELRDHVKDWTGAVQEIIAGLRKSSLDGRILKQALHVRAPRDKWFDVCPSSPGSGIILMGDAVHSTLPHQGQGACQAIESGFALAQTLKQWPETDGLEGAFQFFQDLRKPRTDRITQTSFEAGKMASVDIPEEMWASTFSPESVRERMRWIMEYDLYDDLSTNLQRHVDAAVPSSKRQGDDQYATKPAVPS